MNTDDSESRGSANRMKVILLELNEMEKLYLIVM